MVSEIISKSGIRIDQRVDGTVRAEISRHHRAAPFREQFEAGAAFTQGNTAVDAGDEELCLPADGAGGAGPVHFSFRIPLPPDLPKAFSQVLEKPSLPAASIRVRGIAFRALASIPSLMFRMSHWACPSERRRAR